MYLCVRLIGGHYFLSSHLKAVQISFVCDPTSHIEKVKVSNELSTNLWNKTIADIILKYDLSVLRLIENGPNEMKTNEKQNTVERRNKSFI